MIPNYIILVGRTLFNGESGCRAAQTMSSKPVHRLRRLGLDCESRPPGRQSTKSSEDRYLETSADSGQGQMMLDDAHRDHRPSAAGLCDPIWAKLQWQS